MPRLRNSANGAVVNVDPVTAERLGSAWVDTSSADEAAEEKPKRRPGRPSKSES